MREDVEAITFLLVESAPWNVRQILFILFCLQIYCFKYKIILLN
jgi:hypothetical protein